MNPKSNSRLSQLKGLVFDLDDTLYPQIEYKRDGMHSVDNWLAQKGILKKNEGFSELDLLLKEKGASHPFIFDDFVARKKLPVKLAGKLVSVFIDNTPKINCFPGVISLLRQLRESFTLGILTDGRTSSQEKKVIALNLRDEVDLILYSDSMNLEKPSTKLYRWVEERLDLPGEALAYIGDNPTKDFYGANKLNWLTIQVMTGEHTFKKVPSPYRAQFQIETITGLVDLLNVHKRY